MIGKTISHYKILEELGRGGMGVVYKAEDTKLKRTVALKFLKTQALEEAEERTRFLREAQSAAALDHPNICTVYEVGETEEHAYISMAYIEGESLKERVARGPVPMAEALDYALQAAEGLKAAHDKGIVHRDIKSANLMLTPEGRVKVMDFGLAKTAGATKVTRTGTTLGTVGYMSPEQAMGQEMDRRSDIWSIGVVLYEMLSGHLPFAGEYDPAILYSIVNERQRPLTEVDAEIPLEVERVVERALEKDPNKRYQSADEVIDDLRELQASLDLLPQRSRLQLRLIRRRRQIGIGIMAAAAVIVLTIFGIRYFTGAARAIDSIAVLPFENLTGDSEEDPLVDGMAMELTSTLGQVSGFKKVVPYRSMKLFKGSDRLPSEIADRVDVKALVYGTISYEGDRIKAFVEMIEGDSESLLLSRSFEFEKRELATIMDQIMGAILGYAGMAIDAEDEESIVSTRSDNPEAYLAYLRGRALARTLSKDKMIKGIELLEQAVGLDSTFALAHAVLALARCDYGMIYTMGQSEFAKAKKAAMRALELDDSLPDAYVALAGVQFTFEWDWIGAGQSYRKALDLGQDNADVHYYYSDYLAFMTRFDEAIAHAERAIELDPIAVVYQQNLGWILYHKGRFDESIAQFEKALELLEEFPDPDVQMWLEQQLIWSYIQNDYFDKALAAMDAWDEKWGEGVRTFKTERAHVYIAMGRENEAKDLINELLNQDFVHPLTAVALGNRDLAFEGLERLYEERDGYMIFLKMAIEFEDLRADPRYKDLIKRLNFPE